MAEVPEKVKKLIKKATHRSMWWHDFLTNVFLPTLMVVNILFGAFVLFGGLRSVYISLGYVEIDLKTMVQGTNLSVGMQKLAIYQVFDVVFGMLTVASGVWSIFVRRNMQQRTKKASGMLMVIIEVPALVWTVYFRIIQEFTSNAVNTAIWGLSTIAFALIMFVVNYIYYNRRETYFQN